MSFAPAERAFVTSARVGHLATADDAGRPHVVPLCFALIGDRLVSALDEKPKSVGPGSLTRVRNIQANPAVSVIVDRYAEDWDRLAWVRIDGTAAVTSPDNPDHEDFVGALRSKYAQYEDHRLAARPILAIDVETVSSWGAVSEG